MAPFSKFYPRVAHKRHAQKVCYVGTAIFSKFYTRVAHTRYATLEWLLSSQCFSLGWLTQGLLHCNERSHGRTTPGIHHVDDKNRQRSRKSSHDSHGLIKIKERQQKTNTRQVSKKKGRDHTEEKVKQRDASPQQ